MGGGESKPRQGALDELHRTTQSLGKPIRPSIDFDDYDFIREKYNYHLSEVKIWFTSKHIIGVQTFYTMDGTKKTSCSHEGTHFQDVQTSSLILNSNEYLTRLQIRSGSIIDSITLITNKKRTLSVGGKGGEPTEFKLPEGCRFVSFGGSTGEYLQTLKANYEPIE